MYKNTSVTDKKQLNTGVRNAHLAHFSYAARSERNVLTEKKTNSKMRAHINLNMPMLILKNILFGEDGYRVILMSVCVWCGVAGGVRRYRRRP